MQCSRKSILRGIGAGIAILGSLCAFFLIDKYHEIYHPIGSAPRGMNISIYSGEFSRGFSWWTKKNQNAETKLYLSESAFGEEDFSAAIKMSGDIGGQHFDEIFLIEGQSKDIQDPSQWGMFFSISYCNHTVAAENLCPAQVYHYALGGNGEYIFGEFETDVDDETIVVNFNDFQTSDGLKLRMGGKTLEAALQCVGGSLDFFAFGGDFTSTFSIDGKQYSHFPGWIKSRESIEAYTSGIPMVMASGNHDASKDLFVSNNMICYDGTSDSGGYWSFDYNNVHFAILNTNEFDDAQYTWIEKDLARANVKESTDWIILMLHAGPYTTGERGFSMENEQVEAIGRLASEFHVDLVMQAHDHTFSKTYPYYWDGMGRTQDVLDETVINRTCQVVLHDGIEYDCDPHGTYYVSCGASGHHLGENTAFAQSYGEKSYTNRFYKVAVSDIGVDSKYAEIGMPASMDLGCPMFGVMRIREKTLVYEFYAVDDDEPVLLDRLAVKKTGEM